MPSKASPKNCCRTGLPRVAVDQVIAILVIGKTPQPARAAADPPASLVGVQISRLSGLRGDLLVPGREDVSQPLPGGDQPAGRELGAQVILQDVDELIDGDAQAVVAPAREADQPVAEGGVGQRVGHDRLDVLLARRAVVAVKRVLGNLRLEVLGQVFDDACTGALAALQRSAAARTDLQAMFFPGVDPRRRGSAVAGMALAGARAFAASPAGRVRLRVHRPLARGRAGGNVGHAGSRFQQRESCVLLRDPPCRGEQREGDRVGTERVELPRRDLITLAGPQRRHQGIQRVRTCRRLAHAKRICACALPGARAISQKILEIPADG